MLRLFSTFVAKLLDKNKQIYACIMHTRGVEMAGESQTTKFDKHVIKDRTGGL